jgi:hypothetical protein
MTDLLGVAATTAAVPIFEIEPGKPVKINP